MSKKDEKPKFDVMLPDDSPSAGDAVKIISRSLAKSLPLVGGATGELIDFVFKSPLEKRQRAWMEEVSYAIQWLEKYRGVKPEDLQNNETFNSTVFQATQIAIRNHQKEKLEALRNAIINSALPESPNESLQQMFLNYVDTFTTWHIKILNIYDEPEQWHSSHGKSIPYTIGTIQNIIVNAFPELKSNQEFYIVVWRDLFNRGLVNQQDIFVSMTRNALIDKKTTNLGSEFVKFINFNKE